MSDNSLCSPLYTEFVIPQYKNRSSFLFFSSLIEFSVFLILLCGICRKQWYIYIKKNTSKARQILSPFYDKIIYFYCIVTVIQSVIYAIVFASGNIDSDSMHFLSIIAAMANIADLCLEMFIPILLLQKTIGNKTFKKSFKATLTLCVILCIFIIGKYVNIIQNNADSNKSTAVWDLCINSLMLLLYVFIYAYVFIYQQKFKQRNRIRDRILKIYIFSIGFIRIILLLSFVLPIAFDMDSFCITVISEYIYCIVFPIIAFVTIRNDSMFWQNLFFQLQLANNTSIHSPSVNILSQKSRENENEMKIDHKYKQYRESFGALFGNKSRNNSNDNGIVFPLMEAASTVINIIDYSELFDISDDPIAAGSTSMIHTAIYRNKKVALKQLQFDELDLNLKFITDLFRESLNSNIKHTNIVEFKGVCLRPPELCLIYEYCNCGDLSHLLLSQRYSNKNNKLCPITEKAIRIENRLKILMDIAYGMTALHDRFIIHRDLKTDNILVTFDENSEKFFAKVCDFGSARIIKMDKIGKNKKNSDKNQKTNLFKIPKSVMSRSGIDEMAIISVNHQSFDNGIERDKKGNIISERVQTFMTTKVGTFAFMAPELLIRIDISQMIFGNQMSGTNYSTFGSDKSEEMSTPNNAENHHSINATEYSKIKSKIFKNKNKKMDSKNNRDDLRSHNTQDLPFKISAKNDSEKVDYLTTLYDGAIDVFAFGVIMWEVAFLRRIYENRNLKGIHSMITNGEREYVQTYNECQSDGNSGFYNVNIHIYNKYIDLMNLCWAQNIAKRPKFHQIRDTLESILHLHQSLIQKR